MPAASEVAVIEVRIEGTVRVSAFAGDISRELLRQFAAETMASSDYDPSMDSLVDMRDVTGLLLDEEAIGDIQRRYAELGAGRSPRRLAFVVDSPTTFGYARLFRSLHSACVDEIRIFEAMFDARRWLGLSDPILESAPGRGAG